MRRALLLVNGGARRAAAEAERLVPLLEARGMDVIGASERDPAHFPELIHRFRDVVDRVVVAGGDGTCLCAAEPVRDAGLPLGILPLGTANNLARNLELPLDLEAAVEVAAGERGRGRMKLRHLPVLIVDCQTTATHPSRGGIVELGWDLGSPRAQLVAPAEGGLPRRVREMTGLTEAELREALPEAAVWALLQEDLRRLPPAAVVAHYARFEQSFLADLASRLGGENLPTPFLCTQTIARKLHPDLPSVIIRAVSGFFGSPMPECHRALPHVAATRLIWGRLVEALEEKGVGTLEELRDWLASTRTPRTRRRYFVPREKRLALPESPGIYRMLGIDGRVLYVGKSRSLRNRVNSYFRHRGGGKIPELLTQVRDIVVTEAATPLEAALLETDAIKAESPPYNASLRERARRLWYFTADLSAPSELPGPEHPHGPFPSPFVFDTLRELARLVAEGEGQEGLFPELADRETFEAGVRLVFADPPADIGELVRRGFQEREPVEEGEEGVWTPEGVARSIRRKLRRTPPSSSACGPGSGSPNAPSNGACPTAPGDGS